MLEVIYIYSYWLRLKSEMINPKIVRAKVAMDLTQDKYSAPRTIEKNENPGSCFGATS